MPFSWYSTFSKSTLPFWFIIEVTYETGAPSDENGFSIVELVDHVAY